MKKCMETRKQIEEILLNDYGCFDDFTVDKLLDLLGVMESDCDHEWINHSFDHFGFLQEQICDKCGAKQSAP